MTESADAGLTEKQKEEIGEVKTKGRTLSIVFAPMEGGKMSVRLTGDIERLGTTNVRELSPTEFWALKCYGQVSAMLKQTEKMKADQKEAKKILELPQKKLILPGAQ